MARFFLPVVALFFVVSSSSAELKSFSEKDIVPAIIPKAPKNLLKVAYQKNEVAEGNALTPTQVKDIPEIKWDAEPNTLYTLMFIDPDAPSAKEPSRRNWLHWFVVNIPGNDIAKGDVLAEYIGSGPPKDSGYHRYVFLVYKQTGKIQDTPPKILRTSAKGRPNFNPTDLVKKYNLDSLVAGNFYKAQYDDYVPTLHSQFQRN